MTYQERYNELCDFARNVLSGAMPIGEDIFKQLAAKYQRYLDELPEDKKDWEIALITKSRIVSVKRRDIPKVLQKDKDFAMALLRLLAGV